MKLSRILRFMVVFVVLLSCGCEYVPEDPVLPLVILEPKASGEVVYRCQGMVVDASHTNQGYVMIQSEPSEMRRKVRITHDDQMYTYDLPTDGEYDVYPLQMGNGAYEIKLYESTGGNGYVVLDRISLDVQLTTEYVVFLYPNQYVWYTNYDNAVDLSYTICAPYSKDQQKVSAIYKYVVEHMEYDTEKAKTVRSGYIPNVDEVLAEGKGICFDYAAILAAMLRAQNIPTRLVIGNVQPENILHAWNHVLVNGQWQSLDATFNEIRQQEQYTETKRY
ncbi:MAG: transglutaminase domain-containing protein [Erysipelotrichaceae bacterium]|nr:transglutaminase domain-containing protein [Erysipelotrichaceae bacterium]